MTKRALLMLLLAMLLTASMVLTAGAATDTKADRLDQLRMNQINGFNVGPYPMEYRHSTGEIGTPEVRNPGSVRRPVGSATSATAGIGPGYSIDLTWNDVQWTWGRGRQVVTSWNGDFGASAEVGVHFAYVDDTDTIPGAGPQYTGYNVYDATNGGDWPHLQNIGCDLQAADTAGFGGSVSMDLMSTNQRVVTAMMAVHNLRATVDPPEDVAIFDNLIYYQEPALNYDCTYDPLDGTFGNSTWIGGATYSAHWLESAENGSRDPIVATQFDGTNEIVHLILQENYDNGVGLPGDGYATTSTYHPVVYFRKVGDTFNAGTWSTGQVIDSITFVWTSIDAAPYPAQGVAVAYVNESYYGALLNENADVDIWCRESLDRGVTWPAAFSITQYTNAIAGHPNHFTAWLESGVMYDDDGDLHAYWCAKPTSDDPYFDGFNWNDFDENVYHWERDPGAVNPWDGPIVKVANGNFMNDDMLTGSMNTLHCGFGGSNMGYLGFISMGQCNDKFYLVWSQIHERANRFPWRDAAVQPAPGVLDDCSYTGERLAMANMEILMSVAKETTSQLWDAPRSISNTYTPDCGIDGDPEASGLCGSEWKPALERFALDETGLTGDLTWPAEAEVDLSPSQDYAGDWYLNMEYMDDQFPGPWTWGRSNPPGTENSEKWIRLACVEPIEASQIRVIALGLQWPAWVETGLVSHLPLVVVNEGNVVLNVTDVTTAETGAATGWLSASIAPTGGSPWPVPAGVVNTATFDLDVDATAYSQPTWLDGTVTLTSDAANFPTLEVDIHLLAADHVEPVVWDTVMTHENMFSPFFPTAGECIALGVGNNGDLGWGAGSAGGINMDYVESDLECGTRARDGYYLIGASPFTIMATATDGTGAKLTQVFNDADQADETGFDPTNAKGSIANGEQLSASGLYDSTYTGRFVNSDTTIAMERWVYAPRAEVDPALETINFAILVTKVYPADGQAHNHVTIGNVIDWDVPADSIPNNTAHLGSDFLYLAGTDTTNSTSCQSNTGRKAAEAFGGSFQATDFCGTQDDADYFGFSALPQLIMVDTTHDRDGNPLVPNQPIPQVWWDETSVPGLNANATNDDQAVWFTFKQDYSLGATDTLYYWTVLTTTRDGNAAALEAQVTAGRCWFQNVVYDCGVCTGCCVPPMRGDANNDGANEPTIGDVSIMIDAKFITASCDGLIECLDEADVNSSAPVQPGAVCDDVTIGDISLLIDYLFITGPVAFGPLNPCP